jgi:hypothetical protein
MSVQYIKKTSVCIKKKPPGARQIYSGRFRRLIESGDTVTHIYRSRIDDTTGHTTIKR